MTESELSMFTIEWESAVISIKSANAILRYRDFALNGGMNGLGCERVG